MQPKRGRKLTPAATEKREDMTLRETSQAQKDGHRMTPRAWDTQGVKLAETENAAVGGWRELLNGFRIPTLQGGALEVHTAMHTYFNTAEMRV